MSPLSIVLAALLLGLLAMGCGPGETTSSTSGTGGGGGMDIPPPAAPVFSDWTCPAGWAAQPVLEGTPEEHSICAPPPLPASCPDGMMPVVGEADCQLLGDPCPADDWPAGLPSSGPLLYVQAGAVGGDGSSKNAPLGSIAAAVAAAPSGAVIAIAKGTYDEAVTVAKELTLWGACVTGVTLAGPPGGPTDATLAVNKPGTVTIRNLTITGLRVGLFVKAGAEVEGTGLRISGARGFGILIIKGGLALDGGMVTDTQAATDGTFGRGLHLEGGARATVARAVFDHNREAGVLAHGAGTELTLTDVVVSDTQSQESDQQFGAGLVVVIGAHATVERAIFDHNRDVGVFAGEAGTELTLTDVLVEDTQSQENNKQLGRGLVVESGAHATALRAVFDHNREVGVVALGAGTELTLTDVLVEDTQSQESNKQLGQGLLVQSGAHATALRAVFDHNRGTGVAALNAGTELTLTDVLVKDTQGLENDKMYGRGLTVLEGARATVLRAVFDHNRELGVYASGAGTELMLTDVVVSDTQSQESDQLFGRGLGVQNGARATALRAVFDHNRQMGVVAYGAGTELTLTDVLVNDTLAKDFDGEYGVGVGVIAGAIVEVHASRIVNSRVAGILAMHGGQLTASSCEVLATQAGSITLVGPDGDTLDGPHYDDIADGILITDGSSASLTDVRVAGCLRAGLVFDHSGGSLTSVTSTDNRFGLVLQGTPQPTYDEATCDFSGNHEQSLVPDGNLPVPNAPLDVPEAP